LIVGAELLNEFGPTVTRDWLFGSEAADQAVGGGRGPSPPDRVETVSESNSDDAMLEDIDCPVDSDERDAFGAIVVGVDAIDDEADGGTPPGAAVAFSLEDIRGYGAV
jgi:hypothetical protein